jgi:acyl-ACP thioesterase
MAWPLRLSDVDPHGHVNNAVHWQAVEQALTWGEIDPRRPLAAELDYRDPLDLGDRLELVTAADGNCLLVGFDAGGELKAVARVAGR